MPKLLTLSKQTLANTAVVCIVTLYFEHAAFWSIFLFHVYVKFKSANQSCSSSKINQSINVEW